MIAIVVAASENNVIGKEGKMPWRLPKDLKHFKTLTLGHPVVMGRKTFESMGKPLPGRLNIVITRNGNYQAEGCEMTDTLEKAIATAQMHDTDVFIIGGGEIYRQALSLSDRIYLTRIAQNFEGDAFFPEIDLSKWKLIYEEFSAKDEKNAYDLSFLTYEKNA
jgi:dihydrofolate reductase